MTIHYLSMAADRSEAPQFYLRWIARIQASNSIEGVARDAWERLLETSQEEFVRELAQRQLTELEVADLMGKLNKGVKKYRAAFGSAPPTIQSIIDQGFVEPLPEGEANDRFYIDINGKVGNGFLDEQLLRAMRPYMEKTLQLFKEKKGRAPTSLEEAFEVVGRKLPVYPVPGEDWQYDPENGLLN